MPSVYYKNSYYPFFHYNLKSITLLREQVLTFYGHFFLYNINGARKKTTYILLIS